jgi:hypothetical protein
VQGGDTPAGDGDEREVLTVQFDLDANDTRAEAGSDEKTSILTSARAAVATVVRRACGHTRTVFDRRALDPCAYGATDDWTAPAFK